MEEGGSEHPYIIFQQLGSTVLATNGYPRHRDGSSWLGSGEEALGTPSSHRTRRWLFCCPRKREGKPQAQPMEPALVLSAPAEKDMRGVGQ